MAAAQSIDNLARYLGRKIASEDDFRFGVFAQSTLGNEGLAEADDADLDTLSAIYTHSAGGPLVTMGVLRPETIGFVREACGRIVFKGTDSVRGGLSETQVIEALQNAEYLMAIEAHDVPRSFLDRLFKTVIPSNMMLDEVIVRCRMSEFDTRWLTDRTLTLRNFSLTLIMDHVGERARLAIDRHLLSLAEQSALENVSYELVDSINPIESLYPLSRMYENFARGQSRDKHWTITYDGLCRSRVDAATARDWFSFTQNRNSLTLGRGVPKLYDSGLTDDERAYWKVMLRPAFAPDVPTYIKRDMDVRMGAWLQSQ